MNKKGGAHGGASVTKKPTESVAFPPLSAKAPTPFGRAVGTKTGDSKKVDKNESSGAIFGLSKASPSKIDNSKKDEAQQNVFTKAVGSGSKDLSKKDEKPKSSSGGMFGGFTGMNNALDATTSTSTQQTSAITQKSSGSANDTDFKSILTQFYTKHNASKVGEVDKTLQKYKVRPIRHEII